MTKTQFENTIKLFNTIKEISFFERLFSWKKITSLSMDAYGEFKSVDKDFETLTSKYEEEKQKTKDLTKDVSQNKEKISELKSTITVIEAKQTELNSDNKQLEKEVTAYKKTEDQRQSAYEHKITELNSLKAQMDTDRLRIESEREKEITQRFEDMKATWKNHETNVQEEIQRICKKYTIEYMDKENVPFKGKPDNTIKICGEYIIFDAKSPASDDLSNFPTYMKTQTEGVKKYIKEKDVKKDIFLIIPTNTLETINQFYYNMTDYNVYLLSLDSLEPILLSLKKIENYEFAEQLSPEDRENICRIIGKFAHATKRRIQVDNYFANEFIEIYSKCESLPKEVLSSAIEFEKSDKLNPPQEKRAKLILEADLKKDTKKMKQKAEAEEINVDADLKEIEAIPLYKK